MALHMDNGVYTSTEQRESIRIELEAEVTFATLSCPPSQRRHSLKCKKAASPRAMRSALSVIKVLMLGKARATTNSSAVNRELNAQGGFGIARGEAAFIAFKTVPSLRRRQPQSANVTSRL